MAVERQGEKGSGGGVFPSTRASLLDAARGAGKTGHSLGGAAMDALVAVYWAPVYKHIRLKWRRAPEQAEDLTQGFFVEFLERGGVERYEPEKAAFRTYLRTCVDRHVMRSAESEGRQKRGMKMTLDFAQAESELATAAPGDSPEEMFQREWQRQLFRLAIEDLRLECEQAGKPVMFAVFARYDLGDGGETYEGLAKEMGIAATQVTNHLAAARRALRRLLMARLGLVTSGPAEAAAELKQLLR